MHYFTFVPMFSFLYVSLFLIYSSIFLNNFTFLCHQILYLVNSLSFYLPSSSPKSWSQWKVNVLNRFRTWQQPEERNSRHAWKTSRTASWGGQNDSISVFKARRYIWGGTVPGLGNKTHTRHTAATVTLFFWSCLLKTPMKADF